MKLKKLKILNLRRSKGCRTFGRILRVLIFCLNGFAWTVGMLCILGAMLVGFYSKTVKITWAFDFYDLTLTTPCTILFYYGVALGITTSSGCFAGSGGRWWSTGIYCLLLIGLAIFDYVWGIQVFFKRSSLMDFLDSMAQSMMNYLTKDATFGIFPKSTKEYWDHIQHQSHCCGMFDWYDWKDTPVGKARQLPNSCCNEKYAFPECGFNLGQHPDNADHTLLDIIHTKGCLKAYPRRYIWAFLEASFLGIIVAIILLLNFILSLILFIIVVTCFYRPGKPIDQPTTQHQRRHSSARGHHHAHHDHHRLSDGHHDHHPDSPGHHDHHPDSHGHHDNHRHSTRHHRPRRSSNPAEDSSRPPTTHDQFGRRQRVTMPSGEFEIEVERQPNKDLEVIV